MGILIFYKGEGRGGHGGGRAGGVCKNRAKFYLSWLAGRKRDCRSLNLVANECSFGRTNVRSLWRSGLKKASWRGCVGSPLVLVEYRLYSQPAGIIKESPKLCTFIHAMHNHFPQ